MAKRIDNLMLSNTEVQQLMMTLEKNVLTIANVCDSHSLTAEEKIQQVRTAVELHDKIEKAIVRNGGI